MKLFTSTREHRLWLWTLAVLLAIYSTLGLARILAEELRNRELLDNTFFFGFLVIIAAIVIQALKIRPKGMEIGVWLGVSAVYLMVFLRMGIPEERSHLIEYSVVALLIYEALTERLCQGRAVPSPALLTIFLTAVAGVLDECIQAWLPNRVFDPRDILFNFLAGVMAVVASLIVAWAKRFRNNRHPNQQKNQ